MSLGDLHFSLISEGCHQFLQVASRPLCEVVRLPPIQSSRHKLQIPYPVLKLGSLGHRHDVIHLSDLSRIRPSFDGRSTPSTNFG